MIGDFLEILGDILMGVDSVPTSRRQWAFVLALLAATYVLCFSVTLLMEANSIGTSMMEVYRIAPKAFRVAFILSIIFIPLGIMYGLAPRFRR